jgi:hypothetical protein
MGRWGMMYGFCFLRGSWGPRRIVISEFNRMHWGNFNLRINGFPQASNIFHDPTSKYSTINIRCRRAQSVKRKTNIREAPGSIPRGSTFFSLEFYSFIASEARTGNAANVLCWICLWHMKFSSISMNSKICVYLIINNKRPSGHIAHLSHIG